MLGSWSEYVVYLSMTVAKVCHISAPVSLEYTCHLVAMATSVYLYIVNIIGSSGYTGCRVLEAARHDVITINIR